MVRPWTESSQSETAHSLVIEKLHSYIYIYIYVHTHTRARTHVKASQVAQGRESANAGDTGEEGLTPETGRSSGIENGNLLQYSCLENPVVRGDWQATVHGGAKSWR